MESGVSLRSIQNALQGRTVRRQRVPAAVCLTVGVPVLLYGSLLAIAQQRPADNATQSEWNLPHPLVRVIDGDTLDVDLNGDGRLDPPRERLRLLYIDTPELEPNHKGQDRKHGLPAKAALERLVSTGPMQVVAAPGAARDPFGRLLARVRCGALDVSREIIRLGHSPLDTRFSFAPDYDDLVDLEAQAFSANRGIWADAPSRHKYLARLKKEGRTPEAAGNALWLPGIQSVASFDTGAAVGRYAVVTGVVRERRPLRKGVTLISLGDADRPGSARILTLVVFANIAQRLDVAHWPVAARVRVEGFVARYRGRVEMQLHYARVQP
jgi:endonuclease YncB( thermonuclease family)